MAAPVYKQQEQRLVLIARKERQAELEAEQEAELEEQRAERHGR